MSATLSALLFLVFISGNFAKHSQHFSTLKIIHFPKSLLLRDHHVTDHVSADDFLALSLGFSKEGSKQTPISAILDPFALPKVALVLRVNAQHVVNASHVFPVLENEKFEKIEEKLKNLGKKGFFVKSREIDEKPEIEGKPEMTEIVGKSLQESGNSDQSLESQLKRINRVFDSLRGSQDWPIRSVFVFDLNLDDDSAATRSLDEFSRHMTADLAHAFGDRFLFFVLEENQQLIRRARQTESSPADLQLNATVNLAHLFQADFHAAFATTAFTSLLMALAVYAVAVGMWNLDPGKDSIIYRMTSQRIKKDQ